MPEEIAWERIIPVTDAPTITTTMGTAGRGGGSGGSATSRREHLERILNIQQQAVAAAYNASGRIDLNRQALRYRGDDGIEQIAGNNPDIINEQYVRMLTNNSGNSLERGTTVTYMYPETIDAFCTQHILHKYYNKQYPRHYSSQEISIYSPFVQFLRKNKFKSLVVLKERNKKRVTDRVLAVHYMQRFMGQAVFCDMIDVISMRWRPQIEWTSAELNRLHNLLHTALVTWFPPKHTKCISRTQSMG